MVSYLEVIAAAQTVMDNCMDGDGIVGGRQIIREPGYCGCHVEFSAPAIK